MYVGEHAVSTFLLNELQTRGGVTLPPNTKDGGSLRVTHLVRSMARRVVLVFMQVLSPVNPNSMRTFFTAVHMAVVRGDAADTSKPEFAGRDAAFFGSGHPRLAVLENVRPEEGGKRKSAEKII